MRQKKGNNAGFTLVEVLTVLVIIAILAAVAIPTMSGIVAEARLKSHTGEARSVYVAAQTAAMELPDSKTNRSDSFSYSSDDNSVFSKRVRQLLGEDIPEGASYIITLSGQKVEKVEYVPAGGGSITITGGESVTYGE